MVSTLAHHAWNSTHLPTTEGWKAEFASLWGWKLEVWGKGTLDRGIGEGRIVENIQPLRLKESKHLLLSTQHERVTIGGENNTANTTGGSNQVLTK